MGIIGFNFLTFMNNINQGTDTLGAIASGGRGAKIGTGRGRGGASMGRGSSLPPQMVNSYGSLAPSTQPLSYNPNQFMPLGGSSNNPNFQNIDAFTGYSTNQSQTLHTISSQPRIGTGSSTSAVNKDNSGTDKRVLDLLTAIVTLLSKNDEVLKRLDERTKSIDNNINDISNNLVTKEFIGETLSMISRSSVNDRNDNINDGEGNAIDDLIGKVNDLIEHKNDDEN